MQQPLIVLMLVGALLLSACGGDGIGPEPCDPSTQVTPSQIVLKPGESRQIQLRMDLCGDRSPEAVEWRSEDPSVATVRVESDTLAMVRAIAPGSTRLLVIVRSMSNDLQNLVTVSVEQ
jgi:hypothetical protein